jgi:hypothetical protein
MFASTSDLESENLVLKMRLDEAYAFIVSKNLVNGKYLINHTS